MTMAARSVPHVDPFGPARDEMETVLLELIEAGASHHVDLVRLVTEGMARVGRLTLQGHFDALFEQEGREVRLWERSPARGSGHARAIWRRRTDA
jgi:hypothetical protein